MSGTSEFDDFMARAAARSPGETVFLQSVAEVASSLLPFIAENPRYADGKVLERLTEPDRVVSFRICWEDDAGEIHVNRGYRVQFSNAIGPYKGGIRFHPSVNQSVLKFLGFEQIFKNSLTGLPMGGAKGGADFDPKGRSDREIMRFCQSFMTELYRHVGADVDIPAGDIGVGAREIGFMFGTYKRVTNTFTGVLTGKGLEYGGSLMRPEATGYGAVYFLENMLHTVGEGIEGKRVAISGSGNVALHAAEKILHRGGRPVTLSDSRGLIHAPDGLAPEQIARIHQVKKRPGASLADCAEELGAAYHAGRRPWGVPCEAAMPCATQNELDRADADALMANGCRAVCEGANMPCTLDAVHALQAGGVLFAPGKAANAGGVAMSGLEMSQNSARLRRSAEDLREALRRIMDDIHDACRREGEGPDGRIDYVRGANVAGFRKVADALMAFGVV
ncbi:MAG: NADP-specific glutamate dehydrogenase [Pseudomonadota bacterium]